MNSESRIYPQARTRSHITQHKAKQDQNKENQGEVILLSSHKATLTARSDSTIRPRFLAVVSSEEKQQK